MNKLLGLAVLLLTLQALSCSSIDLDDDEELKRELIERNQAHQFFLRTFFHPGKSKNEEVKREVRERYEEKCESIIPGQR